MKFQGLNKRLHNIFFHTHTVAGIVISFALFIIFFAGAFALFMDESYRWENPEARYEAPENIDIDRAFASVEAIFPNLEKANDMSIVMPSEKNPELNIYAYEMQADSTSKRISALVNTQTYEATSFEEQKTHMMETLYHLHYFGQIPFVGLYLAGFVALFFLFASITGLLIHWKDIIEKFYALRTQSGWKNLWKDAHTTLSLIGLPFQIIYGVTGALLGLSILLLAPSVMVLFNGSQDEVRGMLDPFFAIKLDTEAPQSDDIMSLNEVYALVSEEYKDYKGHFLRLRNYGTEKAAVAVIMDDNSTLTGDGTAVVDLTKREIVVVAEPNNKGYNATYRLLIRLHYATFGGIWLKFIYFIMAILTCFIIVSGILLWQAARDNKKYTDKQRQFHHRVTKVYLNICFSLFPAVAIIFLANMAVPMDMTDRIYVVDYIFFGSWFLLGWSAFRIDTYKGITKHFLLLGTIGALLIPVFNGIFTGDWLWKTIANGNWYIASVDLFWLFIGAISAWCYVQYFTNAQEKKTTSISLKKEALQASELINQD